MDIKDNDLISGVKTFFVVPELSLFPEEYLKAFFLRGYETYFLGDDPYCPLKTKIEVLFSLFPQLILFFNIDRPVRGIHWPAFIGGLQNKYGARAMIGVMYNKRKNPEEIRSLERLYLYTIGIVCGCIPIEYQKAKNLNLFMNVLGANQANGQRKYLRAICDDTYKATIEFKKVSYLCTLRDISISHFSCVFIGTPPEIPLRERIKGIRMNLRGILLKVDGILCLKRVIQKHMVNVFIFRAENGREGLSHDHMNKINGLIFSNLNTKINSILRSGYEAAQNSVQRKGKERPPLRHQVLAPFYSGEVEAELEAVP